MAVLKFLVVDDATFIREMLKKNLRNHFPGSEIMDAASAKKAQVMMKTNRFDLILCDWEMPEMTGEEFLRWVRSEEEYADLPFIMVTSRGERDFIIKAAQAGVSDYLGKPFTPEGLVGKVTKALAKVGKNVKPHGVTDPSAGSLAALTGSPDRAPKPAAPQQPMNDSASVLTGGASKPAAVKVAPAKNKPVARGQAMLTFSTFSSQCVIKDISLQLLSGAIKREETLPTILETVVISIVQNDGEDVARLNGYVHSIQAAESRIDAGVLKLVIRFVDDDPKKLEQLSCYIASL
jgi:DNA-binding response OmpR family regulator